MAHTAPPLTTVRRVVCPLDCPDACTLAVETDGRRVHRVDAAREGALHLLTDGTICGKVRRIARHVHGDARVLTPLARVGPKGSGRFEPITWEVALDRIVERFRAIRAESGPEALMPLGYGGSNGLLTQDGADALFFRRFGATRLLRTLCAAPSGAAQEALYGRMPGMALSDLEHSRLIVMWGVNPHASGIHSVPPVLRALERGAELIVVDPRRTPFAKKASLHLAPRPGTDLPLALAVARELFARGWIDEAFLAQHTRGLDAFRAAAEPWTLQRAAEVAQVPAADIARLAELYGTTRPAALRCGWGVERSRSGGAGTAAILALPALCGHFGVRGSGFAMSAGGAFRGQLADASGEPLPDVRSVNLNRAGRALLELGDPPVRAVLVYNGNPLATLPAQELVRRGLEREDLFTVVHEAVMTDTARYADIVLPATTFLEHTELHKSYGAFALQLSGPAIEPVGEARSNHELFTELLRRLELARPGERLDEEVFLERALAPRPERLAALRSSGLVPPDAGLAPVAFVDVFPGTTDRRIHLDAAGLAESPEGPFGWRPEPADERNSLALISPALAGLISSTFGQLLEGQVPLALHPDDAAARGLSAGQSVRAFNRWGEVHAVLALDANLRPGVACLPKGLWSHHTLNGRTANALVPDDLTDLGGGACFNDARIQVEALTTPYPGSGIPPH